MCTLKKWKRVCSFVHVNFSWVTFFVQIIIYHILLHHISSEKKKALTFVPKVWFFFATFLVMPCVECSQTPISRQFLAAAYTTHTHTAFTWDRVGWNSLLISCQRCVGEPGLLAGVPKQITYSQMILFQYRDKRRAAVWDTCIWYSVGTRSGETNRPGPREFQSK